MEETKIFTRVDKTSQPQPCRKDPHGGTQIIMCNTFVSFDIFQIIYKKCSSLMNLALKFDESYTYDWLKNETYSLLLPGHFAVKFHRC